MSRRGMTFRQVPTLAGIQQWSTVFENSYYLVSFDEQFPDLGWLASRMPYDTQKTERSPKGFETKEEAMDVCRCMAAAAAVVPTKPKWTNVKMMNLESFCQCVLVGSCYGGEEKTAGLKAMLHWMTRPTSKPKKRKKR